MFDKETLDIPCPNCSHTTRLTLQSIRRNPRFTCSYCKNDVSIDASALTKGLDKVERQLKNLFK